MEMEIREIDSIAFGIYTEEEITAMSVCKVDSSKHSGVGSVYDPRMGTTDHQQDCKTCGESAEVCPGHFGHIELNEPIIHPLFYLRVESFLKCFCVKCNRLLIDRDQLFLAGLNKYKGESRFKQILEYLKKIDICCRDECGNHQPTFKYSTNDNTISMVYIYNKVKTSIVLTVEEIKKTFENVIDEDVELLGFDPVMMHPKSFIITVLPVLPPCDRPFVKADGNIGDDDLTVQYIDIVKYNNQLEDTTIKEKKRQTLMNSLRFRILTMYDNRKGKAKHATNSRPLKGIKERLSSKEGLLRSNMSGKRCNFSGRTVIGADPTLEFDELGVPESMAKILTVPVKVTAFNFDLLLGLINRGKANFVKTKSGSTRNLSRMLTQYGTQLLSEDVIVRGDKEILVKTGREVLLQGDRLKRDGAFLEDVKYPGRRRYDKLEIGDIVDRQLQDGDYVLLNRQPTLHKSSMQAMKCKIKPYHTLRINLSITKPFNADFDRLGLFN